MLSHDINFKILEVDGIEKEFDCLFMVEATISTNEEVRTKTGFWPWNYRVDNELREQDVKMLRFLRSDKGHWLLIRRDGVLSPPIKHYSNWYWAFKKAYYTDGYLEGNVDESRSALFYVSWLEHEWEMRRATYKLDQRMLHQEVKSAL